MATQIEKTYQAALLADAAYVTFGEAGYLPDPNDWQDSSIFGSLTGNAYWGTVSDDDVPFGLTEKGRGWTQERFDEFSQPYSVVYHQPNQDNGFSATLFYDTTEDSYITAFRGTEQFWEDVATTDLLLALGLSDLPEGEQHSSIGEFFQAAGLLDASGLVKPEYTGKVDVVGHSLGGHLSLWAMYEYRELFAEVYTFNGAGISDLPLSPDAAYIARMVAANPLTADELGRIHNVFAEEGPELTANDITFFRPGAREGTFIERRDLLGTIFFHSASLLVESLSVYRLLSTLDESLDLATIGEILYGMSNQSVGSLDAAVSAISDLLGPEFNYGTLAEAEIFYQDIRHGMAGDESFGAEIHSLVGREMDDIVVAAGEDSVQGRGYRYALRHALPFAVTAGSSGMALADDEYSLVNFSDKYLQDRSLYLSTLLRMNGEDAVNGDLARPLRFIDIEHNRSFDSDDLGTRNEAPVIARPVIWFGSDSGDSEYPVGSSGGDRLYGMSGDDRIEGLAGADYMEGGLGNDHLLGGEGGDVLVGGRGNDVLNGGVGSDYLLGGEGADNFVWNTGDGRDVIGDYDDGGDRIIINGIDLATLEFTALASGSGFYSAGGQPDITIHYNGDFLEIMTGEGEHGGSMTLAEYAPLAGSDYGIVLTDPQPEQPRAVDFTVLALGTGPDQTDFSAYWRQHTGQAGVDWSGSALLFEADSVVGYSAGSLHGTYGGAFEGGPLADQLLGDSGSNALHGLAGADSIAGGLGDDFLEGGAGADQLAGGDGADIMFGSARAGLADSLDSLAPEQQYYLDQIHDAPGDNNKLDGGGGDDYLAGGAYNDFLAGGPGADYLLGGSGSDHLAAGDDNDVIYGDSSLHYRYIESPPGYLAEQIEIAFADGGTTPASFDDVIHAGAGDDTLWGELGSDSLYGEAGDDTLVGDRYHDPVYFQDELPAFATTSAALDSAHHGDDRLFGGAGRDRLLGLGGDDLLGGGTGNDTLIGGAGNDNYLFEPGGGLDVIQDDDGLHTLVFSGVEMHSLQIQFRGEQVFVGIPGDQQGFSVSRDQWPNVRIALNAPESLVDKAGLDTVVLGEGGQQLLAIAGSHEFEEASRNSYLSLDLSVPNRPFLALGEEVSELRITGIAGGRLGAVMHLAGATGPALTIDISAEILQQAGGFFSTGEGTVVSLLELEGDIAGTGNNDQIIGSPGPDVIDGQDGDDLLRGGEGDDVLVAGPGDDSLHGEAGNDSLDGGPGTDLLEGGPGNDLIHNSGPTIDSFVFANGDGADLIDVGASGGRVRLGEIRFSTDVDPGSIGFSYMNGDAFIDYGDGNRITLNTDGVYTARDNTLSRYTVVSEADPGWVPVITAQGYVGDITGTFGRDIIIGGEHIETIMPSYGDDIIEAGGGPDWIILNDLYLQVEESGKGIGHKIIRGQEGNDTVHTPLHQGLSFHYESGDGHDTINYDWSFSSDHPYQLGQDVTTGEFYFNTYGSDVIVFGPGIELSDLSFYRYDDRLQISLSDATGSVSIANFFLGLDNQAEPQVTQPEWSYAEGGTPASLLDVGVPGLIPIYPLSSLAFADGSVHDLEQILQDSLEDRSGFIYGTQGHDLLNVADDKTVLALAGDDQVSVEGDRNSIDPGSGNDIIEISGADNVVHFGLGDGVNITIFRVDVGATILQLGEGVSRSDIGVSFHPELDELLLISLPTGVDTMQLLALAPDPESGEAIPVSGATVSAVHFYDGSTITGEALLEMASGTDQNLIEGTGGKDVLVGTSGNDTLVGGEGNDTLEGLDGDDRFLVEGTGQGKDRFIGGNGSDRIVGSKTGDTFKLGKFLVADSIEQIDGGEGVDFIIGTVGRNKFDFSETVLTSIEGIEGGAGDDRIFGSAGDDTIIGGEGNDRLAGGPGSDSYLFAAGDGRDLLVNRDSDGTGSDSLLLSGMTPAELWFSRADNHLIIDVVGSDDQLTVKNWFTSGQAELDRVYAADQVLLRGQLELLVQAMAGYDVPAGEDALVPQQAWNELEPLLASAWQAAV